MLANRSIPRCTVIPQLVYPDVEKAAKPETVQDDRRLSQSLPETIERRVAFLTDYQNGAYAQRSLCGCWLSAGYHVAQQPSGEGHNNPEIAVGAPTDPARVGPDDSESFVEGRPPDAGVPAPAGEAEASTPP